MNMLPVEARALYLGGDKISAHDHRVNHSSYERLGLRCTICGEPVHYKNGDINTAHFAHFPTLDHERREDCDRRRTYTGDIPPKPRWQQIDKGQKLELFQKHFSDIIRESLIELAPYGKSKNLSSEQKFSPKCLEMLAFLRQWQEHFIRCIRTRNFPRVGLLQVDIACEAFDYLMVKSSEAIVLPILECFTLQKLTVEEVGIQLSTILLKIKWPEVFVGNVKLSAIITKKRHRYGQTKYKHSEEYNLIKLPHKVEGSHRLFVYLRGRDVFLGTDRDRPMTDLSLLGRLDTEGFIETKRAYQKAKKAKGQVDPLKSTIRIIEKYNFFHLAERSIRNRFLPALTKAMRENSVESKETVVRVGGFYLDKTVDGFLTRRKANIVSVSGGVVFAEVVIDNAFTAQGNPPLLEDFFACSVECSTLTKDNPKVHDALIILIMETSKVLSIVQ